MSWIWCDGSFRKDTLEVSGTDRGLCHGLGIFETVLAIEGAAVALDRHLARMAKSARRLKLPTPDVEEITSAVPGLLQRCGLEEGRARVRIALTGGSGILTELAPGPDAVTWILAASVPPPPRGLTLATSPFPRNELSPLAGIKSATYAENLIALDYARSRGADEALFLNTCGDVCETAMANVFAVINGVVLTPSLESGCLPGIARARVIELARSLSFEVKEQDLLPMDLTRANGVFVTSATRGIVEVTSIDGQAVSTIPLTGVLRSGFEKQNVQLRQTI